MPHARILVGDVRTRLAEIPDGSVRTCITSPPYFGLRDYGTGEWEDGSPDCDHIAPPTGGPSKKGQRGKFSADGQYKNTCRKCGAKRIDAQIGLEETPDEYVANLVAVFSEIRRVLTADGTVWLNLGDSYAGSGKGGQSAEKRSKGWQPEYANKGATYGLKSKDLLGIPWRVAFALQQDGWYLRSDIIWHKPNPMPESVTDRPTKSHEYLFLLTKSPRYYYDHEAIKEPVVDLDGKRNSRDVWTISTKPFKGAHFAVMPEALAEPCILAGSAPGDTVLDPFAGSGTVAVVALRHGRNFVGTELNPEYSEIAQNRIYDDAPMFYQIEVVE